MKRWLLLMLMVLLLCGCNTEQETVTIPTTEPTPTEEPAYIEPTGYYDPDSTLEESSQGALKLYPLNRSDSCGMLSMGEDLLVFSGSEVTTLTKLTGNNLYVAAVANLNCAIHPEDPAVLAGDKGVTYYDEIHRELVFLDTGLKEVSRISMPENILGSPALTVDRKTLYYLTEDALRAIDLESGLDRLLREIFFPSQQLLGLHCGDTVIECSVVDSYGNSSKLFFSTENGETLYESLTELTLWSAGTRYFALRLDGAYLEMLTGTTEQEPALLLVNSFNVTAAPVLDTDSTVLISTTADSTTLDCYDLTTGVRTASMTLPGVCSPHSFQSGADGAVIWFICYNEDYQSDTLYRWDLTKATVSEDALWLGQRYDYENPDLAGLADCAETAAAISQKHNVEILLWQDAIASAPADYALTAEYQVPLIERCLEVLDNALSSYPADFLKNAAKSTDSGKIRLCLVREITALSDAGVPGGTGGLQYRSSGGDACIALVLDSNLERNLYHEMTHIIESRVMSRCSAFDNWDDLNPEGFTYSYNYYTCLTRDDEALTTGENRAFIDLYAMSYPKEDRASIMEYAMMPGNEDCFTSEVMQAKLYQLCYGIRKAFRLTKSEEIFLWEQYLNEPLAPQSQE